MTLTQSDRYRNIVLQNVPGSIYLKDTKGVYLDCNNFQLQMAGFQDLSEIVGKTDYDLPWRDFADEICATDRRIMDSMLPEAIIEMRRLANGQLLTMMTHKAPLIDECGKVVGIMGTSLDMTERSQSMKQTMLAQAQHKSEEEARKTILVFAGGLAHDLRTPLMSMELLNEALKRDLHLLEPIGNLDVRKRLRGVSEATDQLLIQMHAFITQNLKLLRDGAASEVLREDFTDCQSEKGINQFLMLYPFKENQRDLVVWDTSYHFMFRGNLLLFVRILFNLVSNALHQIAEKGRGKIYITSQAQGLYNILSFKDTAGGLSDSDLSHLFQGYASTKAGGTGVGLVFCKTVMEAFGGQIYAQRVEGDCIVFNLVFPSIQAV